MKLVLFSLSILSLTFFGVSCDSRTEVEQIVDAAIAAVGATSIRDMGKVMAELKTKYTGQMDFAKAGPMVKSRLG